MSYSYRSCIDLPDVSFVVNSDLPSIRDGLETYIHSVSGSCRPDRKGIVVNFVVSGDDRNLIQRLCGKSATEFRELPEDFDQKFIHILCEQ